MSNFLLYLGSVYRLADWKTDEEFRAKRHRFFTDADNYFRQTLGENDVKVRSLIEGVVGAKPNDPAGQFKDLVKLLSDTAQVASKSPVRESIKKLVADSASRFSGDKARQMEFILDRAFANERAHPVRNQLVQLAEEALEKFPEDADKQVDYWVSQVQKLGESSPIRSLVIKYGPKLHFPKENEKKEKTLLKGKYSKPDQENTLRLKLNELKEKYRTGRLETEAYLLKQLAEFFLGRQSYDAMFGTKTGNIVTNPVTRVKYPEWDLASGLVPWFEDPKKERQISRPVGRLWREEPFLLQLAHRFLPASVIMSVTPENYLLKEVSFEGNKINDEIRKTAVMSKTLAKWNTLIEKLDEDIRSPDEFTRLVAMVTSIVVHTGIRPGKEGLSILRGDVPESGYEIIIGPDNIRRIKTRGATGLKVSDIDVLKEDLIAAFSFRGKYSTENLAALSNAELIKALVNQVAKIVARGGTDIFITGDGRHINEDHVNDYLKKILNQNTVTTLAKEGTSGGGEDWVVVDDAPITAYSFRRLAATQQFYQSLNARKPGMAKQMRELKLELVDNMSRVAISKIKQKLTNLVKDMVTRAVEDVKDMLSHEEGTELDHALNNYINHKILLDYLSNNGTMKSIEEIVGEGYSVQLKFDPIDFYKTVMAEFPVEASMRNAWMAQEGPKGTGTFAMRGPAMLPFAPDALIAWAENRKWTKAWAPAQVPAQEEAPEALPMAASIRPKE